MSSSSPDERRVVAMATLGASAMIAQQVLGKAARDALFLSSFALDRLPIVMAASAVCSFVAVLVSGRLLARFGPSRVVPLSFLIAGFGFLAAWPLARVAPGPAAVFVYLVLATFGASTISGFWSLVNERFDPRRARAVVARIGTGGTLGGVVGGLFAWRAASHVPIALVFPVIALSHVVAAVGARSLRSKDPRPAVAKVEVSAFTALREAPYLRHLAALVAIGAIAAALLDFGFSAAAVSALSRGPALLAFFGLFQLGVAVASFALQLLVGRASLEALGLAGTVALLPMSLFAGLAGAFAIPGLLGAVLLRGLEAVQRSSLFRSAYELFYTPLAPAKKRPTKLLIDVGADRLGTLVGSGLAALVGAGARSLLAALLALAALALLALARLLQRGYVAALEESLRAGTVELEPEDVFDATTRRTLAETRTTIDRKSLLEQIEELRAARDLAAPSLRSGDLRATAIDPRAIELGSGDLRRVRAALSEGDLSPLAIAVALPRLSDDRLREPITFALRRAIPKATGQIVDAMLDEAADLVVRRRVARVLAGSTDPRAMEGLTRALGDPLFPVRVSAARALRAMAERAPELVAPSAAVLAAIARELEVAPSATERTARLDHVFTLLSLVLDPEPLHVAERALVADDARLRGTALEYLDHVLPAQVRAALLAWLDEAPPPPSRTMTDLRAELLRSATAPRPPEEIDGPRGADEA